MELRSSTFILTLVDEPTYSPGSVDNLRRYGKEYSFAEEYRPNSMYGLTCRETDGTVRSCVLLAGGGGSGVNDHSLIVVKACCLVAVGDTVCSLSLPTLQLNWRTKVDTATCFGVYYSPMHDCLLSHGELEIARLTLLGEIVWSSSGKDIFSEGFRIFDDWIEAIDFNHQAYRIDIATGRSELVRRLTKR